MSVNTNDPAKNGYARFTTTENCPDGPAAISESPKSEESLFAVGNSDPSMIGAAVDFMDEYADVFEELAK